VPRRYLKDAIAKTLTANVLTDAAVRLSISRGVSKRRGLLPEPEPNPSMVIHAEPFTGYPAELYERGGHQRHPAQRALTARKGQIAKLPG
jgi:hypothetical protein